MSIMAAENAIFLSQGLRAENSQKELSGSQNGIPIKDSDHAIFNATVGSVARYAVHCTKDGKYAVSLRVASDQANTLAQLAIELYLDGEIAATFNATSTGGDQNWIDTKSYPVEFKQGFHTLELRWKSDGLNVSRINLTSVK